MSTKFKHDDQQELDLFMPARAPCEDVRFHDCTVIPVRVASVMPHYRTTLADEGHALEDDRFFGLGLKGSDWLCAHAVDNLDRMGHGRCTKCHGHLWCASWVADGWMGDATVAWANAEAARYRDRMDQQAADNPARISFRR
jgi:hypothetical protein